MNVLFDTSVLVASMVKSHPAHARASLWHRQGLRGEIGFLVCAHTILELYAVLTRMPLTPRMAPSIAWRLIRENVVTRCRLVSLSGEDYGDLVAAVSSMGISGAVVYDALLARAAEIAEVDVLLTLNPADFRRVWPEGEGRIRIP